MKYISFCLMFTALLFLSCAKPTDPLATDDKENRVLIVENVYPTVGIPQDMIVTDSAIFLAEDQAGYSVFDRSTGNLTQRSSHSTTFGDFENIRQLGYADYPGYLYFYDRYGGAAIYIADVNDIENPELLDFWIIGNTGNILQLHIKSVEEGKTEVGVRYSNHTFRYGIVEHDNDDYMLTNLPESLYTGFPNAVGNFHLVDNFGYFAAAQRGLYILDLENSTLLSELNMTGETLDVKVQGNYAYLVAKQEGLLVADISDKENPIWVNSLETVGWAQSLDISGDYLVVGSGGGGAYLYDIGENPAEPKLLDRVTSSVLDYVLLVRIQGERVFAAGRYQGITELSINR